MKQRTVDISLQCYAFSVVQLYQTSAEIAFPSPPFSFISRLTGCHFNCHKKCSELVYDNCVRSMYIPTPDELQRSATTGPRSPGTKTVGTTKKVPRRVNSDGMRVSIPPAIVSSSQPLQSLVEKPLRQPKTPVSEQDSETAAAAAQSQGQDKGKSSSKGQKGGVTSPTTAGRTGFLEDAIISAAIRMTLPTDISALPKNDHPPLTIQATTINFTRFVHKTTGLFWFQDRVEDIFTWKDPWNTTFVLVLYCFVCRFASSFLMVVVIAGILKAKID